MKETLETLILEPALEFRPDGKDAKDLDIAHFARYTAVVKDLLQIHERTSPTTVERQREKELFRDAIETLQQALYPWITKLRDRNRMYTTFL